MIDWTIQLKTRHESEREKDRRLGVGDWARATDGRHGMGGGERVILGCF